MFLKNARMVSFCGKGVALSRNSFLKIPKRNGYMVLVPEIGEDMPQKYPLLKEDKSPEFNTITIEKCIAATGRQALDFEEAIRTLGKQIKSVDDITAESLFQNVLNPIEELYVSLNITWGIAKTMYFGHHSFMPPKCYLGIHSRARRATAYKNINESIYQACKSVLNKEESKLTTEQRKILKKYILEGKLNGLELKGINVQRHAEFVRSLTQKADEYSQKVKAATNQFSLLIRDPELVKDFPKEALMSMAEDPMQHQVGPWIVKLESLSTKSFMEYCPERSLRYKVWDATVTRASILHDRLVQTSTVLEEIRGIRNSHAKLLGYTCHAHLSMETKMAGSVENVHNTLDNLLNTARPAQEYEIKELNAFANDSGFENSLQEWDIPYWGRKHLQSVYKFAEGDFKNYFPLPKVLSGVFELIETLFSVKIVESKKADGWHKDVRFFDMFDLNQSSTDPISSFYLDSYARGDDKVPISQEVGYMVTIKGRSKISNTKPLTALIFNFQPPVGDKPSLLSLQDVRVLFQKFGHMLQHALTTVEHADLAGFSTVEWDAVNISDYVFESLLYEPSVLNRISYHQDTNEPLPPEMIEAMKIARTYLSGYNLCWQLFLSRMDLELYSGKVFWYEVMNRLWGNYFVIPQHKRDYRICSFDTIFSGEFAAAYYSHTWSKMLAADLFDAFQEVSSKDKDVLKEVGKRYRETFLALGGSYPTKEIFRMFRGRDPNPKALLSNLRLDTKSNLLLKSTESIEKP